MIILVRYGFRLSSAGPCRQIERDRLPKKTSPVPAPSDGRGAHNRRRYAAQKYDRFVRSKRPRSSDAIVCEEIPGDCGCVAHGDRRDVLRLIEPIHRGNGSSDEFIAEVETLRETWDGRRKNLVWMLDQALGRGDNGS
jgi:hypothetical protein